MYALVNERSIMNVIMLEVGQEDGRIWNGIADLCKVLMDVHHHAGLRFSYLQAVEGMFGTL